MGEAQSRKPAPAGLVAQPRVARRFAVDPELVTVGYRGATLLLSWICRMVWFFTAATAE
jgi:hypothetical protein